MKQVRIKMNWTLYTYLNEVFFAIKLGNYDILEPWQSGERDVEFATDFQVCVFRQVLQTDKSGSFQNLDNLNYKYTFYCNYLMLL